MNEQEKQHKRDLLFIDNLFKSAKAFHSFGAIKTRKDLLMKLGHSAGELEYAYDAEQLAKPVSRGEINELETIYKLRKEQAYAVKDYANQASQEKEYEFEGEKYGGVSIHIDNDRLQSEDKSLEIFKQEKQEEQILASPHQKAKLFKFQNRAAVTLLDGILQHKKRAQLLRAGVGTGKTFILAAVLRQLMDRNFVEENNCTSPWPICWITRASIVEQTKRVCADSFGLDIYKDIHVINIEQLRAKFGDWMISWDTHIERGEEHVKCLWKKRLHPLVFIIDESQLAKNEDSTQSKIIQAIADIPSDEPVYIICSSATPFTRVCEARYFAVNSWMTL